MWRMAGFTASSLWWGCQSLRSKGLGSLIVEELIARAHRRNVRQLQVLTETPWESANTLYRSCGFVEVGADGTDTDFSPAMGAPELPICVLVR